MGLVQGLTEFLPVSSSGHLVLAMNLFGLKEVDLFYDTVLHLGTLAAVVAVFFKDIKDLIVGFFKGAGGISRPGGLAGRFSDNPAFRLSLLIVIGTIPAVIIGLLFKDTFEALFGSVLAVGIALCVTGVFLLLTRYANEKGKGPAELTTKDTLLIGFAQALAITPGISRSGSTIGIALFLGVERELAGKFSFFLAIPAILGATALQFELPSTWPPGYALSLAIGFATSAFVGYGALKLLIGLVKRGKFFYFGFYCIFVGLSAVGAHFIFMN